VTFFDKRDWFVVPGDAATLAVGGTPSAQCHVTQATPAAGWSPWATHLTIKRAHFGGVLHCFTMYDQICAGVCTRTRGVRWGLAYTTRWHTTMRLSLVLMFVLHKIGVWAHPAGRQALHGARGKIRPGQGRRAGIPTGRVVVIVVLLSLKLLFQKDRCLWQ
jgi:hypothetical protein